jgi:hypothetical protein
MKRMFFSVDKFRISRPLFTRRRVFSLFHWSLRPGVAGAFLLTTLFGPASGWGQSRASQMLAGVQHDEFSTATEDAGHFSPERLRARIQSLDLMVSAHNARFARLQGRAFAGGGTEDVAPRVFQAALEKFQTAARMNAEVEMRRARFSQKFAAAGGFQYRTFADGKRMWFKNGRVSRIENEKTVDAFGNTHRQDTTEMVYDKRGNLLSSKTETRDPNGHITVKRWAGTYSNVPGRDRLLSFSETTWDPLGNESRLERTDLTWNSDGKNLLSYNEKSTDQYGETATRRVWDSTHDKDGNLLSFKEESESKGVKSSREWYGATYKKAGKKNGKDEWQLTGYGEKSTDALGRETTRSWGDAKYDDKGALLGYTETTTGPDGKPTVRVWGDAEFDRSGNLTFFRETTTDSTGRATTRVFRHGRYDEHGRALSYEELTSSTDGPSETRRWSGGRYNERNELLAYREEITNSHGVTSTREWSATSYIKGQPAGTLETITDDLGHRTTREWHGRFGAFGRLAGFDEKTTDAQGNISTLSQDGLTYDALGRLVGYDEKSVDFFGRPTWTTWTATAHDLNNRVVAYRRTDRGEDGRERRSERANIVYDAAGRILSYEESLEATGGSLPAASGRQSWKATGYDRHGELTGFELSTTNDRGESDTQRRALTYDQKGRTVGTEDRYTNALGETQTVQWKALRFDAWGNAEKYSETITTAGLPKERVWEGTLDARGLASSSTEMISDSKGLKVINRLSGALYDSRGRITDGVRSTSRSDFPDVAIESVTAGRTYDVSGQVTGGTETTRTHGRVDGVAVDLTTVETAGGAAFVDGRATQTRSTVETTGFWGGERVHTQDTTDVLLGMNGDRSERRTTRAFDAAGVLIKETWNSSERTDVTVDLSGRTLTYQETTGDAAAPKAKTVTKRINRYHGNGELAGYQENSQNAFGVVTRTEVRDLATDALGQTLQSRETTTQPGTTVKTDETYKTGLRYDLLGRAVGGEESTATTGPGLSTQSQSKWSNVLDAAGRVVLSTSTGERDGVAFENETKNTAFDIYGRPIDYHTGSQGFAGVSDLSTSGVRYDEYGRPAQRHEDGWNNGNYSNADVSSAYDDKGREVETIREGYNGQGNFRETVRTDGFNALGQAVGRTTDGWNATEGTYKNIDTALAYDLHGELIGFDREKTAGGKTDVSRWDSKGVNAQGRSLGFTETGKTYENGQFVNDFTVDHTPSAFNGNGQEVAYARVATKTFANGVVETTTTDWKGAYDAQGRMVEFRDEQTISLNEGGVTKEATLSRWREGMTYYEEDGDGHRRGMMSGYDETVFDSASPDKGAKTTVRAMRYDDHGRFLTGETATGEVSRLKDALRRIADVFSGGNLAQAGRNLVAGLERLLANTAQLAADVSAWLKENIAEPSKDFVETIARWLGAPGDAPPVLNPADVEKLVRAVSEKAGGMKEADVPLGLMPAAKSLGVFDQGLSTTRTKAKTFDAQGRAMGWVEETRSAAAPDKVVESEIRLTYAGDTNHVATYAARVKDGEKVSQIFRDNYQYDLLGRATYREARFEGDALEELVDGVPAAGAAVGTRVLNWAGLSAEARTALVDRLAADAVQVVGRVEIDVNESFEHDAAGNVVSRQGDRLVRGNVFTELGLEKILPQLAADLRSAAVSGIKDEIAGLIQKQDEILTGAATKLQQAAIDAERAEKSLEALLSERIPLEEQLKERQAARDSALAVFEAAMRAVSALLGKDLFTSLAGEKKGEEPGNSTTDARGRQVRYAAGDKTTVLDSQWYAVIRVRENGDVVRTYERRDVERTLVFKDDRDVRGWVEESRKDLAPTEDPNPPFYGVGVYGWNNNKGVKLLTTLPVFNEADLSSITPESIDALDAVLSTLRSQFETNNLKKIMPAGVVTQKIYSQSSLQSSLKSLATQLDAAQKYRRADDEWAGATGNLAIHDARVAEAQKALPVLKEALTLAEQDRAALEADTGREKAHLKADEEKRLAEVATELTEQVKNLTRGLAETEVWLGGATVQIPAGFWDALIEKGQAELNGSAWSIKDVEGAARARTRLFSNEKFVRLDENKPDGLSLTWRGDLTVSGKAGPPTFDALRAAGQKALAASTDDERRAAFGLTSDGRLSVSRVSAQTQDAAGRLVAQGVEVLDMTRQGGEVDVRRSTQDTQGFQYDTRGQVVGYTRTTREAGKPDVVERLVGATYDAAGRLLTSDIRLRDPSSGYSGEVQLLTENLSFGPDGAPRHSRRTQIKDGQVSVVEDLGQSRTDALGRVVFSLTKYLSTSLDSWNKSGHNLATTEGERSTTAVWNTSFNVRGEVAASFRATSKTGAAGAWHTAFETTTTVYGAGGRATGSTTKTVEAGRDGAAVLFRSLTDQTLDIVYDDQGRALRQRSRHTENGLTTETWDEGDRLYDALGRLVRTHTKTRDAQGGESEAFWSGTFGAEGRLVSTYRWTLSEGRKTEERSVGAAAVDAQGRTTFPETDVTEWDATGTESQTHRRTESGAVYNIFGMLVSQEVTTRTRRDDGTTATETKNYTHGYDTAGRQTKTWVNGREEAGGKVRTYNSYNEVLAFDTLGRARRTFNRSVLGAVTTDRYSTQDVQYDAKGRTVASRDMARRHGVDEKTGAILDTYTTEINETQAFDAWNRATAYTQTTLAGALKTVSAVQAVYGLDGRVVDQTTLYDENSLVAGSDHRVHREIRQTAMAYDGVGNLVNYVKTVTEGDLVATHTPAMALSYDEFGRSINALERVRDNNGRDEVVGALGTAYNSFGQVVGGQTVTMKGASALLDDKALIAEVAGRLTAGDLVSNGAGLVADSGLEGVWSTRLLSAAYDAQGRQVYTDTVTDKAGHGFKDVVVDVVLAKGWVGKGTGWWYGEQFANALAKLKAEGAEIVYSKFYHGGGVHRRYCESLITYRKKEAAILESHDRAENVVSVFDAFGRALEQTQVAHKGPNTTTTNQWLVYDNAGRMSRVFSNIREEGLNGDGSALFRTLSQSQEFTYDGLGRTAKETTVTWADNQAPYKITTATTDGISYQDGQRVGWTETSGSNDRTTEDVRVITGAGYDGLGRLATYDATVYEKNNGVLKLQYKDLNVRNSYDALGRMALTLSDRVWGTTEQVKVAAKDKHGLKVTTVTRTVEKPVEKGQGGGGIAGLSEDWTTGRAAVAISYDYGNDGSSLSGMRVLAYGTGTHKEKSVQAAGIRLDYHQKNMKYDGVGRVTGYKLITTQVERYQYYKQGQSGLKRKVKSAWTTGSVTTVSDVVVKEYDGYGRQVHTVVTSQRNDINRTWTRTETIVKSFDDQGRVKDVKRTTDSKITLPKSSGGLMGSIGGLALGALLAVTLVGLVVGVVATVAAIATGAVVGMGALSSNWLGGQKIYSHNVVEQTMFYNADGTVDEAKTKAHTRTLEEKSYMMGQNLGDVFMKVTDIAVAVVAVAIAVGAFFVPGAQAATIALAEVATAAFSGAYNVLRQGISTHDLGLFGENKDRAEARQNKAGFYSAVGQTALAGLGYEIVKLGNAEKVAKTVDMLRAIKIVSNTALSVGVAAAAGVHGDALWQVAALSLATSFVSKIGVVPTVGSDKLSTLGKSLTLIGEVVRQVGVKFGSEKQKTTWMLLGTGLSSSAAGNGNVSEGTAAMLRSFLIHEISKKNDGSGAADQGRLERNYVLSAWAELGGALVPAGLRLYNRAAGRQASLAAEFETPREPKSKWEIVRNTAIQIAGSLVSPLKALGGLLYGFLSPSSYLQAENGAVTLSGTSLELWLPVAGTDKKLVFRPDISFNDKGQRVVGTIEGNRFIITPGLATIDGFPIERGEWVKNPDGSFTPVSLDLRLEKFLGAEWAAPPLLRVDSAGDRFIEISSEALGMPGVSVRIRPTDRFYATDPDSVDHGRMLSGGSLIVNGVAHPLISARLARVDGIAQLLGATFETDKETFVLNDKGEILARSELIERLGVATGIFEELPSRLAGIERRVSSSVDAFTEKFNVLATQFGAKGVSPGVSLPKISKERPLANYLGAIDQRREFGLVLLDLVESGSADLAFSRLAEYESLAVDTQNELALLERGAKNLETAVPVLLRSFDVLNRISANATVNNGTRVQDVPVMNEALADFKRSFAALVKNPLVGKDVRESFAKVTNGLDALASRPVDLEVYRKDLRKQAAPQLAPQNALPRGLDWLFNPSGKTIKASAALFGLSEGKQKVVDKVVQYFNAVSPLNLAGRLKQAWNYVATHQVDQDLVAALEFTEDLKHMANDANADFGTRIANDLNPIRFLGQVYRWVEINGDQPGGMIGAYSLFTLGVAMNLFEVLNPAAILAKVMPTVVSQDVRVIGDFFGVSRETSNKVGDWLGVVAMATTFAAGGLRKNPLSATNLKHWGEFGIKAGIFSGSASLVKWGSQSAVDSLGMGGADKQLAYEVMEAVINGGLMAIASSASAGARRFSAKATRKYNQLKGFIGDQESLTNRRGVLNNEYKQVSQDLRAAKIEFASKKLLAKEIESLYKIQANNAVNKGAPSGTRPLRIDPRANPELVEGRNITVLLSEAQRVGEAQRRVGGGYYEIETRSGARQTRSGARQTRSGARQTRSGERQRVVENLEARKRSIRSEIRRIDRQIERVFSAREKAESVALRNIAIPRIRGIVHKGVALFAQSNEPLNDGSLSIKGLEYVVPVEKSPYRAGKEALAAQRGGILAPAGEVNRPFRSLWNRLLGRRETVTNPPANGPPMNLADDFSTDRPIPAAVPRAENNPTIKTIAADDMGFQGGRPISADHPNLSRGPPNQFKEFLESQDTSRIMRQPVAPEQKIISGSRTQFNPINPGPILPDVATTFRSATYDGVILDKPVVLYRVYSDPTKKIGPFWSTEPPKSSLKSIVDNALNQDWGNRATKVVKIEIPVGEKIFIGPAASQGYLVGGAEQVYVPRVDPRWEVK